MPQRRWTPLDFTASVRAGHGLGIKIRRRRHELGLTQSELGGDRFSKSYVSQVESGKVAPSQEALAYFAARLGRPETWFLTDMQDSIGRIRLHLSDVQLSLRNGEHDQAAQSLREAARLAMDLDDEFELARVHENAGHLYLSAGDTSSAVLAYREAAALHRRTRSSEGLVGCICSLANALLADGAHESAQLELQEARNVCAAKGVRDPLLLGRVDLVAGCVALASGNHDSARRLLEDALGTFGGRDLAGVGETHMALGSLCAATDDWAGARLHFERALALLDGVASPAVIAAANRRMAESCCHLGEWERAAATVRQAGALSAGLGDARGVAWATVRLADLHLELGRIEEARGAAVEAASLLGYDATGSAGLAPGPELSWRKLYVAVLARVFSALASAGNQHALAAKHLEHGARAIQDVPEGLLLQVRVLHEQAATLTVLGRSAEASACYRRALAELEAGWPGPRPAVLDYLDITRVPSPLWFR